MENKYALAHRVMCAILLGCMAISVVVYIIIIIIYTTTDSRDIEGVAGTL